MSIPKQHYISIFYFGAVFELFSNKCNRFMFCQIKYLLENKTWKSRKVC